MKVVIATSEVDVHACLQIRRVVFIDEQKVPEAEEFDGLDHDAVHFLGRMGGVPVGSARLRVIEGKAKAQRVAVLKEARGTGVGRAVMLALEEQARLRGCSEVYLGAQESAIPFYETLGYVIYGEPFVEANIPHRMMRKELR